MARITRNVEIEELGDLLGRPGRAALGSVRNGAPVVVPARLNWAGGRWLVGVDPAHGEPPGADEVVLVVDEGRQFFDLRAAFVRGRATPIEPPNGAGDELTWFEVAPTIVVGWDYGRMRNADESDRAVTLTGRNRSGKGPNAGR